MKESQPEGQAQMEHVASSPQYVLLVRERSRLSWTLTAIMLTIYFGYVILIAFRPDILARPLSQGTTTLGIPIGIGVILAGIVLTGLYVAVANRRFDALEQAVRQEAAND